jgi:hypothetical protein
MEERLSRLGESDLAEYLGPLLWSWAREIPICPTPGMPWRPHETIMSRLRDGGAALRGTERFLDTFLGDETMDKLINELARWPRSETSNADKLRQMQEEFTQFRDECTKIDTERKGITLAAAALGIAAAQAAASYLM